jgi:hypothetical protein
MKWQLTWDHIGMGAPCSGMRCPIALLIQEKLKPELFVFVKKTRISVRNANYNEMYYINPPGEVREFIDNFDQFKSVSPLEFELNIPQEYLR